MKIYLATWLEEESQGIALTKAKARNRLLSYFFLSGKAGGKNRGKGIDLLQYIKTGIGIDKKDQKGS